MHIYFGRINENQTPKDQIQNAYYAAKKGSTYFGTLNQFESFANEEVYVFMLGTSSVELWRAREWGQGGKNLYFDKTNVNLHEITRAWVAAFKYFYLDADLIVFTTRRPFKKAFFEVRVDPALTRIMLLDHRTYQPDNNFRHIEVHESMPTISTRNVVLYKSEDRWQFKEPEFYDTDLTKYFRDNMSMIGKGRPNKDSILKMIMDASPLPAVYNPDQLTLLNIYDVFFCPYKGGEKRELLTDDEDDGGLDDSNPIGSQSLNSILYGPPGTGKTYNTVIKAAKIITRKELAYNEAKAVFEPLLGDQVEFITFHQNYSYEDFVLGLRPKLQGPSLAFEKHEGVFYKICERARKNYTDWKEGLEATEPKFETVFFEFLKPLQTAGGEIEEKLEIGSRSFYITDSGGNMLQFRSESGEIESLNVDSIKALYADGIRPTDSKHIYYTPIVKSLKIIAEKLKQERKKVELKNYVLVIDEVNRANISRVFGELITLLEPDKRLGNKHQMLVMLSNGERFSVPKNLHIIATMNTADKSIALLDIALRRRFEFEAMYPNLDLIESPYKEFLMELNKTILEKKGADFMIGHSYLMPEEIESLGFINIMNQKIIPLLNEYFYNNKSVKVYEHLLKDTIGKAGNYEVIVNDYKEVVCRQI